MGLQAADSMTLQGAKMRAEIWDRADRLEKYSASEAMARASIHSSYALAFLEREKTEAKQHMMVELPFTVLVALIEKVEEELAEMYY